jgi:hypothetical protein
MPILTRLTPSNTRGGARVYKASDFAKSPSKHRQDSCGCEVGFFIRFLLRLSPCRALHQFVFHSFTSAGPR